MATASLPVISSAQLCGANCPSCSLCGGEWASRPVRGRGTELADLVVVGEAPGDIEVRHGRPFTGRSGQLLWQVLASEFGIARNTVYATNLLACPIPEGALIKQRDILACASRLEQELAQHDAHVILCLGASATSYFRGVKTSITELNGHTEWSEKYQAHLAYVYHPAAVLRNPSLYQDFVWGVRRAIEALDLPDGPRAYPPIEYTVASEDNLSKIISALQEADRIQPKIVCDLETTGLRPHLDDIMSVGFAWSEDHATIIPFDLIERFTDLRNAINELLREKSHRVVLGHNYGFDVRFLLANRFNAYIGGDTMLLHYTLDERSARAEDGSYGGGHHGLKQLARKYCDAPSYAEGIEGKHLAALDKALLYRYQANDCIYTFRLHSELLWRVLDQPQSRNGWVGPYETYLRILLPAANALARIEARGIRIDRWRLVHLKDEYVVRIAEKAEEAGLFAGESIRLLKSGVFNPNSTVQVAKILYTSKADGGMGYPKPPQRKGKKATSLPTDEQAIHFLQRWDKVNHRQPNLFLDAILDYRSLVHTLSTNIDALLNHLVFNNPDGNLRGGFHLTGTTSGRLSSSGPNLQNIPARSVIKELFIARPGHVLLNADYRRLEVGVLAFFSGDEQLTKDFLAKDFHWTVANKVFSGIIAELTEATGNTEALTTLANRHAVFTEISQRQARPTERVSDPEKLYDMMKELLRRQAKYISFGKMYGEGAESLADPEKGMGVPVEQAAEYSRLWDQTYSTAVEFLKEQVRLVRTQGGWLETPFGRRRRFDYPQSLAKHLANEAMNFPIQSFASDICLRALTKLTWLLPERGLGNVLLTVHDSILFEVREERLEEAKQLIHGVMTSIVQDPDIVFEIDMKVGSNWGKCA